MVHISPETVESFKTLFKEEYGVEYTDQEAWEASHNLLSVFDWLLQEDRKQHPEKYLKENSDKRGRVKNDTIKI